MNSNDDDRREGRPTADEAAMAALFAALVQDSPPSEVSPARVIQQARSDKQAALDVRIKRLKLGRNLLVAAVLAGLVVIFLPQIGHPSSESSATSSAASAAAPAAAAEPSVRAASSAAAPAAAANSAAASAGAGGQAPASAAASGQAAPASDAGSAESQAAGSTAASAGAPAAPAGSAAASSSAAAPGQPTAAGAASASCALLTQEAVTAAWTAFPRADFTGVTSIASCAGGEGAKLTGPGGRTLIISVTRAAPGACGARCERVPGTADAFQGDNTAADSQNVVWVYGNGYQVALTGADRTASVAARIAAGRAVIKALA